MKHIYGLMLLEMTDNRLLTTDRRCRCRRHDLCCLFSFKRNIPVIPYPSKAYFLLHVTLSFTKLTTMSSPHKQFKLPSHQGRKLNEPLLPLHLALAWIIIRVFPINNDLQSLPVYSSQFTQRVLHIVAREILDVSVHSN